MNYIKFYSQRFQEDQFGEGFFSTLGELFNPATAVQSYRKKGVSRIAREFKEEVSEAGPTAIFKSVETRQKEDQERRIQQKKEREEYLANEKRKIDQQIEKEKRELAAITASDDIPDHLKGKDDKWKQYLTYGGAAVVVSGGVLYYFRDKIFKKKVIQ